MELPLVVGVDGSEPSLRAVDWAADEAALRGLPLRLVHASLWERYEGPWLAEDIGKPAEQVMAADIVDAAAHRAHSRQADVKVTTDVLPEEPEYALVRESRTAWAVVLGSRGRSSLTEALLGSVSVTVAGHAHSPVIVLRGSHDNRVRSGARRIVLGVGEEPADAAAVRFAVEEARHRGVPLEAVRAWRCPAHETADRPRSAGEPARSHERRAAEGLESALRDVPADIEVHRRTVEGHARRVLLDAAAGADLLVVGARRREGHFGLQLGRVAHAVLQHAGCPVAVVPRKA
ncbi:MULTISPECIES: universal stress protein [Streptomyces]|uniref:universal stress protein n=1 Tax=Streptomyces TaxID=1883 RepID=UPI00073E0BFD|nr:MULTISPECIES: universal stress protein [unclassified Streptomyces]OYP13154.1 universal stress protein [Streptomyces sp. FBKL.4005]BCM64776.1 putative stress-inducible protein [Streptomyces sp. EAS-AB2608]CUW32700.1 Universal stress protein/MSMEI_3859 [Streptomyces reticuli]